MRTLGFKIIPIALLGLGACGHAPSAHSSRMEGAPLSFAAQPAQMDAQAKALTELSHRIVVQSSIKGAAVGAVVGCGLAVASANASRCLAAAAVGGASGAVVGHVTGKNNVTRRVEKVSPSAVVRTLRSTNAQMAVVKASLPARLAAQEEMLAQLDMQRATGAMAPNEYNSARASIAAERKAIAASLIQTENNAKQAAANLQVAQSQGQTGLDWHISATSKLANEAHSARSSISLL